MPTPPSEDPQRNFEELAGLRSYLEQLLAAAGDSLKPFYTPSTGGFAHRIEPTNPTPPVKWSKSSTSTCLAFLAATGRLDDDPWGQKRDVLTKTIVNSPWESAGLGANNPFTVSFLLEALADLDAESTLTPTRMAIVRAKIAGLLGEMSAGGLSLDGFPPTAFLTYKAVSALNRWDVDDHHAEVADWNWNHLYQEIALVASASPDADVYEIAYSVLIANAIKPLDAMTPQQRSLLRFGLGQFFDAQREDGTWPRSRPLFVYPKLGHAYCFEYELLSAMLGEAQLGGALRDFLPKLRRAARALDVKKYPLGTAAGDVDAPYGWSSGHHGADPAPESWSTAAALHFCFGLGELIAEEIRRATFAYVGADYTPPRSHPAMPPYFNPSDFLDSEIDHGGSKASLSEVMDKQFLTPLIDARKALDRGRSLPGNVPTSAIFYGPPGTSKTELAKLVAGALGWPLLALDPSHLTRRGLNHVHAEANTIFRMLEKCERIVVLMDEFDELVRDRDKPGELESRFLTTAMLPKLTALSRERRIVYLVATNHLEQFDAAIRRPGRFDLVVPVMPPTVKAKLNKWPPLKGAIERIKAEKASYATAARKELADLTYLEAKALSKSVEGVTSAATLVETFEAAAENCTLRQPVAPPVDPEASDINWKEQILSQGSRNRGLGF
jgi:hypothetical protein